MAETLVTFHETIAAPDGREYQARACGGPMPGGTWQGWLEFIPIAGGDALRSGRETTQPNRTDTEYWATGLTPVYLEGALRRALEPAPIAVPLPQPPSVFDGPAPAPPLASSGRPSSVLDPFSVIAKGEALLRKQLAALSSWHLVNIALEHQLSNRDAEALNHMSGAELIETIVSGVRARMRTEEAASAKHR
jgi:hypothetical protein